MLKESSDNHNENSFLENASITNEKMICKDGFCSLPNQEKITKQAPDDMNLFDPI